MAKAVGISRGRCSASGGHTGSQPHRIRTFKLSKDPKFADKLKDVVGLYVDPPAHAVRAVDRREEPDPGARPHPAWPADEEGTLRHDDPRLQAQRHHHAVRRPRRPRRQGHRPLHAASPASGVHPLSQHHRDARCRPTRRSTWSSTTMPPTSIPRSWLGCSAIRASPSTSRRPRRPGSTPSRASSPSSPGERLKRGVFTSIVELQAAINRFIAETNDNPKPFVWTADAHPRRRQPREPKVSVNPLVSCPPQQRQHRPTEARLRSIHCLHEGG